MVVTLDALRTRLADQRVRFVIVGAWNTLFGYLAFLTLYACLHDSLHYLIIGVLAHFVAVVQAFTAHRVFVFRSHAGWVAEFARFNLVQLASLCYGLAGLWLLVSIAHLNPLVAQGAVLLTAVALTYIAHRRFTFVG